MTISKFITLSALTLTTLVAATPIGFAAEQRTVTTDGTVQFQASTDEIITVLPPLTEPEVQIPPTVPDTSGPLTIVYAPNLDFGKQIISNKDKVYSAAAILADLADNSGQVPYTHFAQVSDTRGTNTGWTLSVTQAETGFTSSSQNSTLKGAQISFLNPTVHSNISDTILPTSHSTSLNLVPGEATPLVTAGDQQGAGATSIVWGSQETLAADSGGVVRNPSITLSVPGSTAKDAATYSTTLDWSLSITPENEL